MRRTVFITGASSGFGRTAALLFKEKGWNVAASMRSPSSEVSWTGPAGLFTPRVDVTDIASMQTATDQVIEKFGRIDVLVNNAGFGLLGPLEGARFEDLRREFDTNVLGAIGMIQMVLPVMRKAGAGIIINVSSVGGRATFPLFSTYHATKFALEGLSEALQYELHMHGIRIKLVEPGASKTNFGGSSLVETPHPAYHALSAGMAQSMDKIAASAPGPEKVAEVIYKAATDRSSRLRYPVLAFPVLLIRGVVGARIWSSLMLMWARRAAAKAVNANEKEPSLPVR